MTKSPTIDTALIIEESWLDRIVSRKKTWEMRTRHTHKRGWIGLIAKGSGQVIGVARLTESIGPLTNPELAATIAKHRVPEAADPNRATDYRFAWALADARRLPQPVSYRHPSGAVIWVRLSAAVTRSITAQIPPSPVPSVSAVEAWLAQRFARTRPATKYLAGFRLSPTEELALDRVRRTLRVWVSSLPKDRTGIRILNPSHPGNPYSPVQPRSSNLRACAPTLAIGHRAFHLELDGLATLEALIRDLRNRRLPSTPDPGPPGTTRVDSPSNTEP